ncbi:hypothetical protein F5B21DRAFT_526760, partial [Xylaria acuta]
MAYPQGDPRKVPRGPRDQLLETINNHPPRKLQHCDLHDENIMLGDLDRIEHHRFPVLKIIDFGLAFSSENAIEENIAAVGSVMGELIWRHGDMNQLINDKQRANIQDPNLDSELLMLAAQCVANDPASRPSLSRLLSVIRPNTRRTYPNIPEETDLYISQLVQKHIFDAA